jgi:DNA polymerase V
MFALVDCNNFYVSCERLFRPDLESTPVAVLSNNDGCIIARSEEIKALGVEMGTPFFKAADLLQREGAVIFSSNYTLYGDISHRVMSTLASQATELEVYSIDEAFICLKGMSKKRLPHYGKQLQQTIKQHIGIPVSVGLAPTKTLAKLANRIAKKHLLPAQDRGVFILSEENRAQALTLSKLTDIWGIGAQRCKRLNGVGIMTPLELAQHSPYSVQQLLGVQGAALQQELQGLPVLSLEKEPSPRHTMTYSRSFPSPITHLNLLKPLLATFVAHLAEKLRRHQRKAQHLRLFLHPSFQQRETQANYSRQCTLPQPSHDTRVLYAHALQLLQPLTATSFSYKKLGVMALNLCSEITQPSLFETPPDPKVMDVIDEINQKMGVKTVMLGSALLAAQFKKKTPSRNSFIQKSPRYTTRWSDLPKIKLS